MVTLEHLIDALEVYVNEEITNRVAGLRKWAVWAMARPLINEYAVRCKPILQQLGYLQEDGMVDSDQLLKVLEDAARKQGAVTEHIPLLNADITFSEKDVEKLRMLI